MRALALIILFVISPAHAEVKDYLYSITGGFLSLTSDSSLSTKGDKDVFTFIPNIGNKIGLSAETKYLTIGYVFTPDQAEYDKQQMTQYQDLRINFYWRSFDVRLNYQRYEGASVTANGFHAFYPGYEVRSENARAHYYFQPEHLKYIREGKDLVEKVSRNRGFGKSSSTFVGINIDRRRINLPDNLIPPHQDQVDEKGLKYDTSFSALSLGPLIGGDMMFLYGPAYLRGKAGFGPAVQVGGYVTNQLELALNLGIALFKRHMLSVGGDIYTMEFKDTDQRISNTNAQFFLGYTYAFLD